MHTGYICRRGQEGPMDGEDTRRILDLVAAGKLTVDEAERLLRAIEAPPAPAPPAPAGPPPVGRWPFSAQQLSGLRAVGVSPEWVRAWHDLGFRDLSVD